MKALFSMWDEGKLWTVGRVVAALGTRGRSASWEVIDDPSNDYGGDTLVLKGWARNRTRVTGSRVVTAAYGSQLIEGEIRGFIHAGDSTPWIVLRADDSTYWEVETLDKEALDELEAVLPPAKTG